MPKVESMTIAVPEAELEDLRSRLLRTRWPQHLRGTGWSYGTDAEYLQELITYWVEEYDWRAEERRLNRFDHFRAVVDGIALHFVRFAPPGSDTNPASPPILLLHGWPGSFVQMLDLAELLVDTADGDSDVRTSYEVIVGSLPGFGFSDSAIEPGMNETRMAELFDALMTGVLGFDRYIVHGTDFGAGVASELAAHHPEHLTGVHIGGTSPRADGITADESQALQLYAQAVADWREVEVGYSAIQSTRPDTLATALNDSPAGLASWIIEKFRRWSDCDGDVERRFTKNELLTNVMIYWVTGTIGSSMRAYREAAPDSDLRDTSVPIAHLMSDRDMLHTPREWVARSSRIDRWSQVARGGHFIEWEEPALVADDIRAFIRQIDIES
jgi:pimeloyl-ACP methyl ester carboxylesterase